MSFGTPTTINKKREKFIFCAFFLRRRWKCSPLVTHYSFNHRAQKLKRFSSKRYLSTLSTRQPLSALCPEYFFFSPLLNGGKIESNIPNDMFLSGRSNLIAVGWYFNQKTFSFHFIQSSVLFFSPYSKFGPTMSTLSSKNCLNLPLSLSTLSLQFISNGMEQSDPAHPSIQTHRYSPSSNVHCPLREQPFSQPAKWGKNNRIYKLITINQRFSANRTRNSSSNIFFWCIQIACVFGAKPGISSHKYTRNWQIRVELEFLHEIGGNIFVI